MNDELRLFFPCFKAIEVHKLGLDDERKSRDSAAEMRGEFYGHEAEFWALIC